MFRNKWKPFIQKNRVSHKNVVLTIAMNLLKKLNKKKDSITWRTSGYRDSRLKIYSCTTNVNWYHGIGKCSAQMHPLFMNLVIDPRFICCVDLHIRHTGNGECHCSINTNRY